jgi:hypothetical protein
MCKFISLILLMWNGKVEIGKLNLKLFHIPLPSCQSGTGPSKGEWKAEYLTLNTQH